jgi:predicted tellurium resistance membrane protein TerC
VSVQATETRGATEHTTPPWLWFALLVGAVVTIWWAWFVGGFLQEPSAIGRVLIALLTMIGTSLFAGLAAAVGAVGLVRKAGWGRPVAWIAAVATTVTGVGAIAGVPAVVGLWWSRKQPSK